MSSTVGGTARPPAIGSAWGRSLPERPGSTLGAMPSSLEIRVLGELELLRDGQSVPLPASKKTRALLGYLVVVGARAQPRQRLCELFWDGPDDPRAGLRWSLTKIRPLVDDASATCLVANREHVVVERHGAVIDLVDVESSVGSLSRASLDALRAAAARYRGELLEGLDLPECYRYHEWCIAERERTRRLRGAILAALVERLAGSPEEALAHARARVSIDPLAEPSHIAVMRLLAKLGRPREAIRQYETCRRILEAQLGRPPSKELEVARASLGQVQPGTAKEANVHAAVRSETQLALIGRPCSSHVYQLTPTPASKATSSRRRPGVRRRAECGSAPSSEMRAALGP